jgi:hypothetical protein
MASEKKRDDHVVDVGGSDESPSTSALNNPTVALLCYCASSILMTVTNKYVLSGMDFNLNFLLLCVQSAVALLAIQTCKTVGIFHYRDFKLEEAKKCMQPSHREDDGVLTIQRVPNLSPPHRIDLHRIQGAPIPLRPSLYYLQEHGYYCHCIR